MQPGRAMLALRDPALACVRASVVDFDLAVGFQHSETRIGPPGSIFPRRRCMIPRDKRDGELRKLCTREALVTWLWGPCVGVATLQPHRVVCEAQRGTAGLVCGLRLAWPSSL
jgi:hypothetical protein